MRQEQEDIQRLIGQARRAGPDDEALARVWQRLQTPPPAGPGDGGIEAPDPSALADATGALAGKAALVAGLKTIVAAAVIGAAIVGGRGMIADEPRTANVGPIAATVVNAPEVPVDTRVEAEPVVEQVPPVEQGKAPGRDRAAIAEVAGPGQERKLVEAAQAALLRGETGAALVHIDMHGRRFARGLLADEREVLRVLALCAERREAEAEAAAQALLARSGPGLFLARLQASCVGERLVSVQQPRPGSE